MFVDLGNVHGEEVGGFVSCSLLVVSSVTVDVADGAAAPPYLLT